MLSHSSKTLFQLTSMIQVCYPHATDSQVKEIMELENRALRGVCHAQLMNRIQEKLNSLKHLINVSLIEA